VTPVAAHRKTMISEPRRTPLDSESVLVHAPRGRDADLTIAILARANVSVVACADVNLLCARLDEGAGAAILVEEALTDAVVGRIVEWLGRQPAWSDFPFVVVTASGRDATADDARWSRLGNVAILERPVRVPAMIAAVSAALRTRRRQYEARKAIEARDQFLAMLGHELRNPLAAVRLASSLLARGGDAEAAARHRLIIERQTGHLARLIDDLLDVARVTYGKVSLKLEHLNLDEVLRASAQAAEQAVRAGGLSLRINVESGLPVCADRVRLEQIVANLLNNAIKYTPRGGTVALDAKREKGMAVLRVIDSGVGLDGEMLPRVFELFAQVDKSLDRSQGGLGIGLTLVRSLVQLHGGSVQAKSAGLGRGAEFRVELPLALPAKVLGERPPAAGGGAERRGPGARILVVEDGEDVRAMLKELLEVEGHEVLTAGDGPGGVRILTEANPDIAFVDIGLPGFDGYEVARRAREAGVRARLVALTGYGQETDRAQALSSGFDEHLTKPVDVDDLRAAIGAVTVASSQDSGTPRQPAA